ncbi:hypothetical protein NFI96_002165 [Prochilodus magdalenae]|nr:hypothetical protein NFI96_002165 [Prochilodus magdalenae]
MGTVFLHWYTGGGYTVESLLFLFKTCPATPKNGEPSNACGTPGSSAERTVQRTGKVVYIVEEKHSRAASGFLKFLPDKPFAMFSPVDHRVPRVNVPLTDCPPDFPSRPGDYTNMLFICRITHWPADSTFAEGYVAESELGCLEHPHTVPADGAVGVEVEGHQVFWTCDNRPFILVLTTVPPHTDSLGVSTKTKAGLVTEDDPLPF